MRLRNMTAQAGEWAHKNSATVGMDGAQVARKAPALTGSARSQRRRCPWNGDQRRELLRGACRLRRKQRRPLPAQAVEPILADNRERAEAVFQAATEIDTARLGKIADRHGDVAQAKAEA